jgi:hypothetical protein
MSLWKWGGGAVVRQIIGWGQLTRTGIRSERVGEGVDREYAGSG